MVTQASASGSDGITDCNTVFIDTSLDTHLITVVSPSETVSDLKKKVLYEHALCFPHIGEIKILGLKVMRRGKYYHLSESMLVKNVFHGVKKSWFITVDASSLEVVDGNRNFVGPLSCNLLAAGDTVNIALDNRPPPKSTDNLALLTNADDRQLQKQNDSCDQHLVTDVAGGDGLRNMEMGLKLMEDTRGQAKFVGANGASCPSIQEKGNHYKKGNEIQNMPKEGLESICRGGICDKTGSILPEETAAEVTPVEEDNRKRKRKRNHNNFASEKVNAEVPETGMHSSVKETEEPESSLANANGVVSYDDDAVDEPRTHSSPEATNKDRGTIVQRLTIQSERTSEVEKIAELDNAESRENSVDVLRNQSLENNPRLEPSAKKRRRVKQVHKGDEDLLKDGGTLVIKSNKVMLEHSTISQKSLIDKQPRRDVTVDGSSNGTPEAVHLKSASPSNKRGRKKKSGKFFNQEATAVPSSIQIEEVEHFGMRNNSNVSEKTAAALATGKHAQDVTSSEPSAQNAIDPKHKQGDTAKESNLRPCSLETDTKNKEVGNLEDEHEASGVAIESDVKRKRVSKDHHAILAEDNSCAEVQVSDRKEKMNAVSRHGNGIHNDHQNHSSNQNDGIEEFQNYVSGQNGRVSEERDFAQVCETVSSEMFKISAHDDLQLKANGTVEGSKPLGAGVNVVPPKSSKKKKKSKKTTDLASVTPSTSVTEHVKGFKSSISPAEQNKSAISDHPINTLRKEIDRLPEAGREMESMSTSLATDKEINDVNQSDGVEEHQNHVSGQNGRVYKERDFAQDFSSEVASSEKFKLSAHEDLQLRAKETSVGSKPLGADLNVDSPKSSKKRKKSKKTMDLASTIPAASANVHLIGFISSTSPTEQNKFVKSDHPINTLPKEGSDRLPEAGRDMDTMSTSFLATDKEINDVIQNVVDSVQQMGEDQVGTESIHGKSRKKSRKKQNSDAKVIPESTKQNENIVMNNAKHTGYSTEVTKQATLANTDTTKHPIGSLRESEKDSMPEKDQGIQSAHPMTQKPERNSNKRCLVAVVSSNQSRSDRSNEVTVDVEVSCESSGVNFNDYFTPKKLDLENVGSGETPVGKTTDANGVPGTVKTKNQTKSKKHDANSNGPSPDFKTSLILSNNHGVGAKPRIGDANSTEVQASFTKANTEKAALQSNKKPPKPYERGAEPLVSSKSHKLNSVPEEARRSNNAKPSESINDSKSKRAESNLKSSKNSSFLRPAVNGYQSLEHKNHKDGGKGPAVKNTEVVNSLKKGSLIGLSGSIFNDDSDEASSREENDSDASTRTPSDVSLSSDYSDGESNAVSFSLKREEGGRKMTAKPFSSEMSLDKILRSSFSYKKAKLTASQSQVEDTEGQPIDVVPEIQSLDEIKWPSTQ